MVYSFLVETGCFHVRSLHAEAGDVLNLGSHWLLVYSLGADWLMVYSLSAVIGYWQIRFRFRVAAGAFRTRYVAYGTFFLAVEWLMAYLLDVEESMVVVLGAEYLIYASGAAFSLSKSDLHITTTHIRRC